MRSLKKNQIIIYTVALMLVTAGYLNYTSKISEDAMETANQETYVSELETADIGDATLVSSNDVVNENETETTNNIETNSVSDNKANNVDNENNKDTKTKEEDDSTENLVETSASTSSDSDEYFVQSKLERETMYSQMIETYENILNSSNSLETQKQSATQEITKINETKNSIMICENLIQTKGFSNNVVFVNGESVSVIIGAKELKQEETAQIQNIISRELNSNIENIHISTK